MKIKPTKYISVYDEAQILSSAIAFLLFQPESFHFAQAIIGPLTYLNVIVVGNFHNYNTIDTHNNYVGCTQETHLLHEFPDDFYGSELYVCVSGYLRQEMKFDSLGRSIIVLSKIH